MTTEILIAGFGGQGVLYAGKFLAYKALLEDKKLSWLPSYGPEMRGGTANCSVIISDDAVGSPIVSEPDVLMVLNLPSFDKYEMSVKPGGQIYLDSTLVEREGTRSDVSYFRVPATAMAREMGAPSLANMILVGKLMKECPAVSEAHVAETLEKIISARHADLKEVNNKALELGMSL